MNIFKKRPLSLILCIMLGGFSLFVNTSIIIRIASMAIIALALYFLKDTIRKHCRTALPYVLISALAISIVLSQIFTLVFYPKYSEEEVRIEGQIVEVNEYAASYGIVIETTTIEFKKDTHKLLAYVSREEVPFVEVYNYVSLNGCITEITSNDQFDADIYYNSRGISATIANVTNFTVLGKGDVGIEYYMGCLRELAARRFDSLTGPDTSSFLRALVLGDKSDLDSNTKLNFKRIGISHILALSGMHLSILAFGIAKLLSIFKIHKKIKLCLLGAVLLFYMALTGFSSTICRAGIMVLSTYALFLLRYKSDIFTSLMISITLIVMFEPYAIFDLSLQLSFLSMLGVISATHLISPIIPVKKFKRILFIIPESVIISLFANLAILPIIFDKFGTISLLSPISTLMFGCICTLLIYIGLLILLFGNFLFMADFADLITKELKRCIEVFSDMKWAYSSINFDIVKIIAILGILMFIGFILVKPRNKRIYTSILASLYVLVIILSTVFTTVQINKDTLKFSTDSSDSILIKADGKSTLIYTGGNSNTSAYTTVGFLESEYLLYLDCLILQNYNTMLIEYVEILTSNIKIDKIRIQKPQNEFEKTKATELANLLKYSGADLRFYSDESNISLGEYTFTSIYHTPYQKDESSENVYTITDISGKVYTYVSEGTRLENFSQVMRSTHCLIIGNYGDTYSSSYRLMIKCDNIKKIIVGCNLRFDELTEDYYKQKGATVYYTAAPHNLLD